MKQCGKSQHEKRETGQKFTKCHVETDLHNGVVVEFVFVSAEHGFPVDVDRAASLVGDDEVARVA